MRILYVEDNLRDIDLTARQLREDAPSWRLETVGTIKDALARLERLDEEGLDLVLVDVRLPDGDGVSLLDQIRNRALPLAVVVITGRGDEETAVAALKASADDYIVKHKDYLKRLSLTLKDALHDYRTKALLRSRPLKVLYAEHNPVDRDQTLSHLASHAGHIHLEVVKRWPEALARIERRNGNVEYDVILLDYHLPGLNALDTLKQLRQVQGLDVPVILVTGHGDEEVASQAIKLGASSYLVKNPGYLYKLPAELENAAFRGDLIRREKALRLSQERYRMATMAGRTGVWDWNMRTGEMYVDPQLMTLLGYEENQTPKHIDEWRRFVHPEDVGLVMNRSRTHLASEAALYEVEHRMLHKDGSVRWFLARGTITRDDKGRAVRMIGTHTDITERKMAEEALKHSEATNRAMLKAIPDLMFLNSKDGVFLDFHTTDLESLYASPEHFLGKRMRDVLPEELAETFERCIEQAGQSSEPIVVDYSLLMSGEERYYECRMVSCNSDKVLSVVRDVTERKRAEDRLRRFFDLPLIGMAITSPDRRFVEVNQKLCDILGYSVEELEGMSWVEVSHPDDVAENVRLLDQTLRGETEGYVMEKRFIHRGGRTVYTSISARCVRRADGTVAYLALVVQDITERKLAEEALRQSEARLQMAQRAARVGTWEWNIMTGESTWSEGIYELLGLAQGDGKATLEDFIRFLHPEDRKRALAKAQSVISNGEEYEDEFRVIRRDGAMLWLSSKGRVVRGPSGMAEWMIGINIDITERKLAGEALRWSEERFRQLAENIGAVFFISEGFSETSPGQVLYVSPSYETVWGRSCRSLYEDTRSWVEAVHPDDRERVEAGLLEMQSGRGQFDAEFRIVRPDGEIRWVHDRVFPVYNEDWEIYRVAGIVEDITDHKRADEELRESEERLRLALEAGRMGVWDWDVSTDVLKWSSDHFTILGLAPFSVEPTYEVWAERVHPDDYPRASATMEKALREKTMYLAEYRIIRPDGAIRWVESRGMPLYDREGQCTSVRGLAVDITERKLAEEALRQSKERYRSVVDSQTELICRYLPDTTLTFVNDTYCRYFGKSREELIGTKFLDLIPEPARDAVLRHIESLIETPRVQVDEHQVILPGGAIGWQRWADHAIYDSAGNITEFQSVGHDITDQRRAEDALLQRDLLLQAMFHSLSSHVVVLDRKGVITYASKSWREFANENQAQMESVEVGANYMKVFQKAGDDRIAMQAHDGIRSVMDGEMPTFTMEYPCHSPTEQRWFLMCVDSMPPEHGGVVISHTDITERKLAEVALREAHDELYELKDQLHAENIYLQEAIMVDHNFGEMIGRSDGLKKVLRQAEQVAPLDTAVLIMGETGTGKELLAHAIHNLSRRKTRAMVKVNCATLPSHLIESELFGHERGAFTGAITKRLGRFEIANGGTIFLDEIGELPLDLQAKLLRVLQEGEFEHLGSSHTIKVDIRVIAATNRDLEKAVEEGLFRADLFYRLSIFPITIPPLRERKDDIPMLVTHYLKQVSAKLGKVIETIPHEMMEELQNYSWPGNIRELRNVIERAAIITQGTRLRLLDSLQYRPVEQKAQPVAANHETVPVFEETLEETERKLIINALEKTYWRVDGPNGAAILLGLHPNTLRSRMKKLNIARPKYKTVPPESNSRH